MIVLGLTGGIGTGKTTAAKILGSFGFPVYDADKAVHALLAKNGRAVAKIKKCFPSVINNGAVDRQKLSAIVFGERQKLKALEAILHPLVRDEEKLFLSRAQKAKPTAVVLEIPLLFETKADKRCDVVLVTTAARAVQKDRVLVRQGMTLEKFNAIVKHQMSEKERKQRADFVINTSKGLVDTRRQLGKILLQLGLI